MNDTINVPGSGGYRDVGGEMSQVNTPLPTSAATISSFGASTAWRRSHVGNKGLMKGLSGTLADFNTSQVDPTVR
jgi:hypothetical protein